MIQERVDGDQVNLVGKPYPFQGSMMLGYAPDSSHGQKGHPMVAAEPTALSQCPSRRGRTGPTLHSHPE